MLLFLKLVLFMLMSSIVSTSVENHCLDPDSDFRAMSFQDNKDPRDITTEFTPFNPLSGGYFAPISNQLAMFLIFLLANLDLVLSESELMSEIVPALGSTLTVTSYSDYKEQICKEGFLDVIQVVHLLLLPVGLLLMVSILRQHVGTFSHSH